MDPITFRDMRTAAIARAKTQILQDIAAGRVPADVVDFATLHDFVDATITLPTAYRERRARIRAAALVAREADRAATDRIRRELRGPVPVVMAELLAEAVR